MRSRPAKKEDIAAIRALARRAYIKYVPRIGRAPAPMVADFQFFVDAGQVQVMEAEESIAGYVIAFARQSDYFIENVAVDPAVAGKGVGKALMQLAEDNAHEAGRDRMVLYTNIRMYENFPFYEALGYRTTGLVSEAGFRRVYFEKELKTDEC